MSSFVGAAIVILDKRLYCYSRPACTRSSNQEGLVGGRKMPLEIDLIETLYGVGEVAVPILLQMADTPDAAWRVLAAMRGAQTAALVVIEAGDERRLSDWEIAAILRNRLKGSREPCPSNESLVIRATDNTDAAYHRDFGNWYYGRTADS
jgi:hypothetical protein